MSAEQKIATGLEGIITGKSSICEVDEENCELYYRGYSILDLAEHSNFEEVAYLLLKGELPGKKDFDEFREQLSIEREIPQEVDEVLKGLPAKTDPMDVLKIAVGILHTVDPDASSNEEEANMKKAIRLLAKIPTLIADQYHFSHGNEPVKPNPHLSLAANFLYMLKGKEPEAFESDALDKSLILYAEHELNASTFAARVVVSTLSDMHSGIIAAIGALKGPLHGGANERAMEMLLDIGEPEKAESWIKNAISQKKKIMGFGHRVYKKMDPRNPVIKKMSKELGERQGVNKWFEISEIVEKIIDREKGLHPNLDFYASSSYYLLGIPIPLYTPIFVASRVSGWIAHVMEQYSDNRLIRPRAEYTGEKKREYLPIEDR
ncbi:MAG TPA: citrate/2-methylcitrate synthase [Nitrospinota bacterium]|nr:citrate/2-methylcitrate synthase [Nitrospinota bacterium]